MKAQVPQIVRPCRASDFEAMYAIINEAAQAYRGVIPADRWVETSVVLVRQPSGEAES